MSEHQGRKCFEKEGAKFDICFSTIAHLIPCYLDFMSYIKTVSFTFTRGISPCLKFAPLPNVAPSLSIGFLGCWEFEICPAVSGVTEQCGALSQSRGLGSLFFFNQAYRLSLQLPLPA